VFDEFPGFKKPADDKRLVLEYMLDEIENVESFINFTRMQRLSLLTKSQANTVDAQKTLQEADRAAKLTKRTVQGWARDPSPLECVVFKPLDPTIYFGSLEVTKQSFLR
jgi:hypothetical protein